LTAVLRQKEKIMKKVIAMLLATAMCVATLTACGSESATGSDATSAESISSAESTQAASTEEAAATVSTISEGKLIVGTNAAFPPFEYIGDDGNPDGFDIALIKAIGEKLGLEVEIQDMEFGSLVAAIGSKIDCSIAGMTITEERKQSVDFSDSYYDATQYVVALPDGVYETAADLEGKTIGCQLGTTGEAIANDIAGATVHSYDKAVDAVNDLVNGKVDLVIIDQNPAQVFAEKFNGQVVAIDGTKFDFDVEQYAIALPKGSELVEQVNAALAELIADGTFDALAEQYLYEE
jgi:polar amino acid transport system substrate-binding protein